MNISDGYRKKLYDAQLRKQRVERTQACMAHIHRWLDSQEIHLVDLATFDQDLIKDQESINKRSAWGKIITRFNQYWGDEAAWRDRLERSGIPFADRSDIPPDLWQRVEPRGTGFGALKEWLDRDYGGSAYETRGRFMLSLVLWSLVLVEAKERPAIQMPASSLETPQAPRQPSPFARPTAQPCLVCGWMHDESLTEWWLGDRDNPELGPFVLKDTNKPGKIIRAIHRYMAENAKAGVSRDILMKNRTLSQSEGRTIRDIFKDNIKPDGLQVYRALIEPVQNNIFRIRQPDEVTK